MLSRQIEKSILRDFFKGKTIIILGPRQSGKTTLLNLISRKINQKVLWLDCDEPDIRKELYEANSEKLKAIVGNVKVVLIDESQRVKNIGLTLKLLHDKLPDVQVVATGSSALELSNEIKEPLTGRTFDYRLFPFSTSEMLENTDYLTEKRLLERRLIFGLYPDVINNPGDERRILNSLSGSYLYKDLFSFQDVRKPEIIENLLELLALQIGSEVSYHELAKQLGIDQQTIRRYIDLLEKAFVVFRLRAFNRNVRNEVKKSRKIYFYDNGIRNAIISNLNPFKIRTDKGELWENFMVSERRKFLYNSELIRKSFFWRTHQQQEVDYIEESEGQVMAWEFKFNPDKKVKIPLTFKKAYPVIEFGVVNSDNYLSFL